MLRRLPLLLAAVALMAAAPAPTRPSARAPKKTVAILYFDNHTGKSDYDPLGKGIASMMISDLSVVPEIQLVERERMQDLLDEAKMQQSGYFDQSTAVKTGKMMGAEYVVIGAFANVEPEMRIDTRVVRVETGEVVKTAEVTGDGNKFFDLEQKLADRLVNGLGIALSPEEQKKLAQQQESNRVDAVSTVAAYSQALNLFDRQDYEGAVKKMAPVMKEAPNSMVIHVAFSQMKAKALNSATNKAKDKIKAGIGGLLKRPPTL